MVYHICKSTQEIEVGKIESISYWYDGYFLFSLDMGNYSISLGVDEIFLTREEAEQALVTDKNVGGKEEGGADK
jgi:hypothetical protein